ncbi:MAG: carotenoid oxygenase family protein [Sandaracinaceae bacterium]
MLHPRVPRAVLRFGRDELDQAPLVVHDGALPTDLAGHVFVVGPVGTVDPAPLDRRTTLMNGDGMVARFDLAGGRGTVTTRLLRTPDQLVDRITAEDPELQRLRFHSAGLVRFGLLGGRDYANTALVPMATPSGVRLLATYDAGRPVAIDPVDLRVVTAIGGRDDWTAEALPGQVFPVVLTPAHPAYDARTGELFTVNYGRGLSNLLMTVPFVHALDALGDGALGAVERVARAVGPEGMYRWLDRGWMRLSTRIDRCAERFQDTYLGGIPDTFTDLVRWSGDGALEHFRLVLPNEREVRIEQSIHQIAVTARHVVVMETAFKLGFASGFNDPIAAGDRLERLSRSALTRPQRPSSTFYVVPRAALDDELPVGDDGVRRVTCRAVTVPLEADHFLADYREGPDGHVTLHVAHAPATDLGEWVRPYDRNVYTGAELDPELFGMLAVGAMDVGRLGRYVIDPASGELEAAEVGTDPELMWAIGLYAGAGLNTPAAPPATIDRLYWCTEGFFPELLTRFVYDLYEDYPHRLISLETIRSLADGGRPSAILAIDAGTLRIADRAVLPTGVMAGSMQHVPGGAAGYLVCTVYVGERSEVWVYDAADLAAGPRARAHVPGFPLGFSLHTAWLPELSPTPPGAYRVDVRRDIEGGFDGLLSEDRAALAARLEADVYPAFAS